MLQMFLKSLCCPVSQEIDQQLNWNVIKTKHLTKTIKLYIEREKKRETIISHNDYEECFCVRRCVKGVRSRSADLRALHLNQAHVDFALHSSTRLIFSWQGRNLAS